MPPDIEPFPDLRFAESGTAPTFRADARRAFMAVDDLDGQIRGITTAQRGVTPEREVEGLMRLKADLDRAGAVLTHTAEMLEVLANAAARLRREAPAEGDITAAWGRVCDATMNVVNANATSDAPAHAKALRELQGAKAALEDLVARRHNAIATFKATRDDAVATLESSIPAPVGVPDPRGEKRTPIAPAAPAPAPAPAAPAPSAPIAEAPAPESPAVPMPAAPAPSPSAPAPSPDTELSGGTPPASAGITPGEAAVAGALMAQPQQSGMPQMPVVSGAGVSPLSAPAPAQPERPAEQPFANAPQGGSLDNVLLPLLANIRSNASTAAPATTNVPSVPVTADPPVSYSPVGPGFSTPGSNPVATGIQSQLNADGGTGKSYENLPATGNNTGRADGTPAASAFATKLSAATAEQVKATPAGTAPGTAGAPMVQQPMVGMGGPAAGNGAGKDGKGVRTNAGEDFNNLTGAHAIGEAVPGGTIAQDKGDDERLAG